MNAGNADPAEYLKGTRELDIGDPLVRAAAAEAAGGAEDETEKARRLFYYVRDRFRYNMYPKSNRHENYYASSVIRNGEGWCFQKSMLMAALSRASGIAARLVFAEVINHSLSEKVYRAIGTNHFSPHTFAELFINGRWVPVTPVFDRGLCASLGVPPVEFDGRNPALLGERTLAGDPYMEYVSKTQPYAGIPWEYVLGEIRRLYKEHAVIWFAEDFEKDL